MSNSKWVWIRKIKKKRRGVKAARKALCGHDLISRTNENNDDYDHATRLSVERSRTIIKTEGQIPPWEDR